MENNKLGEEGISKRLESILIADRVMAGTDKVRSWVGCGGFSNHSNVLLQFEKDKVKPPGPFKFNNLWFLE
jgi:hypothetical protein